MAEYIEREALKNEIATSTEPFNTGSVFRAINRQAAADVATVVHGRWMKHIKGGTLCSRCGSYTQHNGDVLDMSKAIACPWCGAKMDGGADHEADCC